MLSKKSSWALVLAGVLALISVGTANADSQIEGVWACGVVRPANLSERPLTFTFHADGTATYSSATNISNLGFTGRAGGNGEWKKVAPSDYNFKGQEMLYLNGNAGGRFLVDATLHYDKGTDELCTVSLPGNPPTVPPDPCPTDNFVRATAFVFSGGLNDPISGEVDLLNPPPGGNGVIRSALRCSRLNTLTTYGSTTPVFPIPAPTP